MQTCHPTSVITQESAEDFVIISHTFTELWDYFMYRKRQSSAEQRDRTQLKCNMVLVCTVMPTSFLLSNIELLSQTF